MRALYVAVERIKQLDNGKVEWRMACSSVSGGWVPKFIEDLAMPKTIAAVSSVCSLSSFFFDKST